MFEKALDRWSLLANGIGIHYAEVMDFLPIIKHLGIALALGLLVGLQRERVESQLAGIRTFPLVTVLGTLCALLAQVMGGWILAAGFVGLAGLIVSANFVRIKAGEHDPGLTTETAMLVMYGLGAYIVVGQASVVIALGGCVAVLLYLKPQLHRFAARIGERDFKAIMQFVIITMVILPVLPNESYGPYNVLNPFRIWLMVALVVGISLGGYIAYKFFGQRTGAVASGVLGGLISSTATTFSYARSSRKAPASVAMALFVIMAASGIVFVRVLVLIGTSAPAFLTVALYPMLLMLGLFVILSYLAWRKTSTDKSIMPAHGNPSEIRAALFIGLLYAVLLLAVAAAKEHLGQGGLYGVAIGSGLTDMDAITLSISQMVGSHRIEATMGWRLILTAAIFNLVFKAGVVFFLGARSLFWQVVLYFGVGLAGGWLLILFWPG